MRTISFRWRPKLVRRREIAYRCAKIVGSIDRVFGICVLGSGVGKSLSPSVDVDNQSRVLNFSLDDKTPLLSLDNTKPDSDLQQIRLLFEPYSKEDPDSGLGSPVRESLLPLKFDVDLAGSHRVSWHVLLSTRRLFVPVGTGDGNSSAALSKEAFIELLECAEERLDCEHVIVAIPKDAGERGELEFVFSRIGVYVSPN